MMPVSMLTSAVAGPALSAASAIEKTRCPVDSSAQHLARRTRPRVTASVERWDRKHLCRQAGSLD